MGSTQQTLRSGESTLGYPMIDLENEGAHVKLPNGSSSTSSSRASSPTEFAYLTHTSDHRRLPILSRSANPSRSRSRFSKLFPPSVIVRFKNIASFVNGPGTPRPCCIQPVFGRVQALPAEVLARLVPNNQQQICLLGAFYILWLAVFVAMLHEPRLRNSAARYESPLWLSCTSRVWPNSTFCGIDGEHCRPFDRAEFAFHCPSGCKRAKIQNPYTVGAQEINYRSLVIGGPTQLENATSAVYRGDSFICGAAIHASIVQDHRGGCGITSLLGERRNFPGADRNGIESLTFNASFPLSFTFKRGDPAQEGIFSQCTDPRWRLLAVSVTFTSILSILTTSPAVFFGSIFTGVFFHVALASDPPDFPDFDSVVSAAVGRFLPAAFLGLAIYLSCVRQTLRNLNAQVEKTVLWLGACWTGALANETLDFIPIQRLTPHDLKQQPGAIPALIFIVLLLLAIALAQAWAFRVEGRLPRYLALYAGMSGSILLLLAIPGLKLRIHHYILALLLLPGTCLQTRPSLVYQGLLVGLFINGVARWGFASILQTPAALLEDGQVGSLLPEIVRPIIMASSITFSWAMIPTQFNGISVLVNDVERYRGFTDRGDLEFSWNRSHSGEDEYFRFAYVKYTAFNGPWVADYTRAGTWRQNGEWIHVPP